MYIKNNSLLSFQKLKNKLKFADLYILDIPAVLRSEIVDNFTAKHGKENSEFYYSFLYTIYSIPNIILPIYGGVLSDLIGIKAYFHINL